MYRWERFKKFVVIYGVVIYGVVIYGVHRPFRGQSSTNCVVRMFFR